MPQASCDYNKTSSQLPIDLPAKEARSTGPLAQEGG